MQPEVSRRTREDTFESKVSSEVEIIFPSVLSSRSLAFASSISCCILLVASLCCIPLGSFSTASFRCAFLLACKQNHLKINNTAVRCAFVTRFTLWPSTLQLSITAAVPFSLLSSSSRSLASLISLSMGVSFPSLQIKSGRTQPNTRRIEGFIPWN